MKILEAKSGYPFAVNNKHLFL